jgi:hypothetical protein
MIKIFLLSVSLFSILSVFPANYAPVNNGNYNNVLTWDLSSVPTSTDDIYYAWASATRTINLISNHTINNITLKGSSLTLIFTASSPYTLTINGNLNVSNNATLIIGSNVTLVVNGQTNFSGDGGTLTVKSDGSAIFNDNFTSSGNGSDITVESGANININSTIIVTNGATSLNIYGNMVIDDLTASGGSQSINVHSGGSLTINNDAKFSGSAGFDIQNLGTVNVKGDLTVDWNGSGNVDGVLDVDGTLTTQNNLITVGTSGVLTAGKIIGDVAGNGTIVDESTLPITLTYFKGYVNGVENILTWQTSSEVNNDYFLLEYSCNTVNWETISTVKGNGNRTHLTDYSFITHPETPVSYYRLTQFDYNGDFEVFNIISVVNANIVKNNIKDFDFTGYLISVYSVIGKLIYITNNDFSIDLLNKGIYFLKITDKNNNSFTIKYYKE